MKTGGMQLAVLITLLSMVWSATSLPSAQNPEDGPLCFNEQSGEWTQCLTTADMGAGGDGTADGDQQTEICFNNFGRPVPCKK